MKRFMYLSIGVLCLTVSVFVLFLSGSHPATAHNAMQAEPGILFVSSDSKALLDSDGVVWGFSRCDACDWEWRNMLNENPVLTPPVALTDIKFWDFTWLVTNDNTLWVHDYKAANGQILVNEWVNVGPWPGTTVETRQQSWGNLKGKYNAEGN